MSNPQYCSIVAIFSNYHLDVHKAADQNGAMVSAHQKKTEPQSRRNAIKWLMPILKLSIVVSVIWAVHRTLTDAWTQLGEYEWSVELVWLVVSGIFYTVGLLLAGLFWHYVLKAMGQDAQPGETLRAYFVGHLGKYVPGKAMVVILRAGLVRGHRVSTSVAAVSVFFETLTMMSVGAFLAAATLAIAFRDQVYLFGLSVALMILAGLPTLPPIFKHLVRLAGVGKADPEITEKLKGLGFGLLSAGWLLMTVAWLFLGLSLWAVLKSLGVENLELLAEIHRYVASVSLAMVAGFLSLIPGGAVVRELVLTELMAPQFGGVVALVSALLLRIVWLLVELLISGILYFGLARDSKVSSTET